MTCAELEILLADYVDGTLPAETRMDVEQHLSTCALCAEFARDCSAAVEFIGRAAEVEAPPELVTKLIFEVTQGPSRSALKPSLARRIFGKWIEPILQPRFAMGMAMTMLSFAMLFRFAGIPERQLKPSDLDPVQIWMAAEDRVVRLWAKGVKYYDNLRVVYEIQTRLQEWSEEQPAEDRNPPAQTAPAQQAPSRGDKQ